TVHFGPPHFPDPSNPLQNGSGRRVRDDSEGAGGRGRGGFAAPPGPQSALVQRSALCVGALLLFWRAIRE
ncbi:unnamed protein product, partial [Effrenium voratum]